ncbi:hypothetical protein NA57DRAFT_71985 [Rhizodiscina lignyota]|uniref:Helix-turn-helix domain-containing protein n=1 Tax=Rhizodiscina lignyota TaxID=1504668 RepID=A0A9P4MD12_9PEZI|nr:hypothetical protein NA57DRAFT_71985 [Rhizodiscina lignyota]
MGSSTSKAARTAAGASARKYPNRVPPTTSQGARPPPSSSVSESQPTRPGPTVHPEPQASETKNEAVKLDSSDPVYASNLRTLGAVQPNPILSHTSTNPIDPTTTKASRRPQEPVDASNQPFPVSQFAALNPRNNPAIAILEARQRLQEEADREFQTAGRGRKGVEGRQFLDVVTLRQILQLRDDRGMSADDIEQRMGLKKGVVARLGPKGMFRGL